MPEEKTDRDLLRRYHRQGDLEARERSEERRVGKE